MRPYDGVIETQAVIDVIAVVAESQAILRVPGVDEREVLAARVAEANELRPVLAQRDGLRVVLAVASIGADHQVVQHVRRERIVESNAKEVGGKHLPPTISAYWRRQVRQ